MTTPNRAIRRVTAGLTGSVLAFMAGLSPVTAAADDIIVIEFDTTTTESAGGPAGLMTEAQRETRCTPEGREEAISRYTEIDRQIRYQLVTVDPLLEAAYDELAPSERDFDGVLDEACQDPDRYEQSATIIYSTCRMTMRDGFSMIDVRFPPGTGQGWMTFLDPETLEAIELPLQGMEGVENINFTQFLNQDTGYVQGTDSQSIIGPGAARDKDIDYDFTRSMTLAGNEYTFDFNFELNMARSLMGIAGAQGMNVEGASPEEMAQLEQFLQMAPSPKVHSSGSALIAPDAPGLEIIREFYKNFAAAMGADGSYLTGLYNHRLLAEGMPIELDQTTEVQMPGIMGLGATATEQSQSRMEVTGIVGPLSTDYAYCESSIIPPEYTVSNPLSDATIAGAGAEDGGAAGGSGAAGETPVAGGEAGGSVFNIDICDQLDQEALENMTPEERASMEQLCPNLAQRVGPAEAGAASGTPAGAGAPDLSEAMSAVQEAMNSMTPEERAAMEQFSGGLGALLGGAGAVPGAAPPAAATPSPAPARSGPSSSDLMTDDLTQSVQNLLQALGYDPGNTDGEATMQTAIAISQYQAEKGLEVTGEVSPQLAGILSAEVDQ